MSRGCFWAGPAAVFAIAATLLRAGGAPGAACVPLHKLRLKVSPLGTCRVKTEGADGVFSLSKILSRCSGTSYTDVFGVLFCMCCFGLFFGLVAVCGFFFVFFFLL